MPPVVFGFTFLKKPLLLLRIHLSWEERLFSMALLSGELSRQWLSGGFDYSIAVIFGFVAVMGEHAGCPYRFKLPLLCRERAGVSVGSTHYVLYSSLFIILNIKKRGFKPLFLSIYLYIMEIFLQEHEPLLLLQL